LIHLVLPAWTCDVDAAAPLRRGVVIERIIGKTL
jgi:hypothetical protein